MKKISIIFLSLILMFGLLVPMVVSADDDLYGICGIVFDANGGSGTMESVWMNGNYTLPECTFTAPEGMQFKCWAISGHSNKYPGDSIYLSDVITAKAVWEQIPTKVVFDNSGDSDSMDEVAVYGDYVLPECALTAPEGMQFKCWLVADQEKQPGETIYVDAVITVSAVWENIPAKITFDKADGEGEMDIVEVYGEYTLPECEFTAPDGYKFKAWQVNDEELKPGDAITVERDTTVTALWEEMEVEKSDRRTRNTDDAEEPADFPWIAVVVAAVVLVVVTVLVTVLVVKRKK